MYMSTNDKEDMSPSILWEAAKAYLRGSIISYSAAKKRDSLKQQLKLEKELGELETEFMIHPSRSLSKKVEAAESALDELLTQKAKSALFYAWYRLYELGDKPGRLLARLAAGRRESNTISSLIDRSGDKQYETKKLTKMMQEFL